LQVLSRLTHFSVSDINATRCARLIQPDDEQRTPLNAPGLRFPRKTATAPQPVGRFAAASVCFALFSCVGGESTISRLEDLSELSAAAARRPAREPRHRFTPPRQEL
jgi:hypothetical protein